jgi:hypothetical protein
MTTRSLRATTGLVAAALLIAMVLLVRSASAQTSGQWVLQQKNAGAGFTLRAVTGVNSRAFGLDSSGNLTMLSISGGSGSAAWGDITGTLSAQTDLASALGLKAPLASPTFTGTVSAPNYTLTASEVDTLSSLQSGIGWRDDRFTLQGPEGSLQMYETGDPLESVLYWAGRLTVGSLEAAEITGEIDGALVTSGVLPASVMDASTTQPLRSFVDNSTNAGTKGLTYANTGPNSQNEPTNPGTYYAQILVVDGDPDKNYLEGRIRSKAEILADLDLEIGTDVQAYSASTSLLGSSIDLTSEVTGILPPANMGTGSSITTKYLRGDGTWQALAGGGDAATTGSLDQFADVTQTATKTLAITESTTLAGGTHSGTNTGDQTTITGNAGTATALQTARTINGTSFDGTANITVTAAAGTLTGSTLASGVTASSLTSLGTIATGVWQGTAIADSYISSAATWNAKQAGDADLTTYAGITPSANVQSLLGAADYAAMRTQLGLVIGTNVQAYDADLTTYAGITPAANVQSLLAAADYSAMRTQLGLVIGTNVQAYDADLTTYAGITPAANVQSLLGAADYSAMRTQLGLVIGTDVIAPSGNGSSLTGITQSQVSGLTTTDRPQFANVRSTHSTLTYAATTDIDLDTDGFQTLTLTGNITFTTSNRAAGRSKTIRIVGDSSLRTFTFPGWTFVGAAAPASLAANKDAILTITAFGTADTDIVAAYAVEP